MTEHPDAAAAAADGPAPSDPRSTGPATPDPGPADPGLAAVLQRREWLELFFDLVVVAGIAVLAEGLAGAASWADLGLFAVLFATLWFSWVSVTTYSDVAGPATRSKTMLAAMLGVAVMAAANPLHDPERANAFALAFVAVRGLAARGSLASGRLLTTWSGLQSGGALVVWVGSMWVPAPAKFGVWAVAIVLDIALSFVPRRTGRLDRGRAPRRDGRAARGRAPLDLTPTGLDEEHLAERLGLFFIIVLGEAISRIVLTSATAAWSQAYLVAALAAFILVISLFRETFLSGFGGLPANGVGRLPADFLLASHLGATLGIVVMAAGIGRTLDDVGRGPDLTTRVLLCGGLGLYLVASTALGLRSGSSAAFWLRPTAGLAVLALACVLGGPLGGQGLLWVLVSCVAVLGVARRDRAKRPAALAASD